MLYKFNVIIQIQILLAQLPAYRNSFVVTLGCC